ncbi:MAG TPA: twin-arginine translocation signal domain-containing protein, partial [Xanthobacteraceae bacterium]
MPRKVRGTDAPETGRRKFLKTAGVVGAAAAATIAMPQISRAQTTT